MPYSIDITDTEFENEVLDSKVLVVVDFWAPWCSPCKTIAPILEEIAENYGDKLKIIKINIDSNMLIAQRYNVKGIPTIMLFKNRKCIETKVGIIEKSQLISLIDNNL